MSKTYSRHSIVEKNAWESSCSGNNSRGDLGPEPKTFKPRETGIHASRMRQQTRYAF